jgi:hypothetical protein
MDPEADLHVAEIKVRLLPGQMARLCALAAARDAPRAVVARELIVRALAALEAELNQPVQSGRRAA